MQLSTKQKAAKTEILKNAEQWLQKGIKTFDIDTRSALDCFK